MLGPRPLEPSHQVEGGMSPVHEHDEPDDPANYQYVPDHVLPDDRSAVITKAQTPTQINRNQSARSAQSDVYPPSQARSSPAASPNAIYAVAPREYPDLDDDYAGNDDVEYNTYHTHDHSGQSSAQLPLVNEGAPYGGAHLGVSASVPGGHSPGSGYSGVSPYDEEDIYGAYAPRSLGYDEEQVYHDKAGQLSPHGYFDQPGDGDKDAYPPTPNDKAIGPGAGQDMDPRMLPVSAWWRRATWGDVTPAARREWEHRQGLGIQRWPFACWGLGLAMCAVMVYQLVHMHSLTGSVIQTKPSINYMIGPSGAVLINEGARFDGCIKSTPNVSDISWVCPAYSNKASVTSAEASCTMSDVCGFGGWATDEDPNQTFRFVTPIFLHAGLVHLLLNMLAQWLSCAIIERQVGTPKFLVMYFASGIFGFILGGNFALSGIPSVGASGAIFGVNAALLVDLVAHWSIEYQPKRKLFALVFEFIIGMVIGVFVSGVDNFSHLGGFAMGLLCAVLFLPIVHPSPRHKYIVWALRAIALPLLIVMFVVLVKNFYKDDPSASCSWCRYLSCYPTSSNNYCKGTGLTTETTSSLQLGPIVALVVSHLLG